ncbi:MAG: amino acid-binding protein [Bacteroidales bacterium]|nr:amino acid-binding protein [Bacteroidales bacterium]
MTVHQLSVFLENKSGTLVKVLKLLKEEGVQLIASTIADTAEYGICRIICSEPDRAYSVLKDAGVAVSLCEVFAIELDDVPGRAADAIEIFSKENISIAYLYSFLLNGKGVLIFRTDNAEKAREVIMTSGLKYIAEKDLSKLL